MINNVAIAFGTGACINSWNPIVKALRDWHKPIFEPSADSINSMYSIIVYFLRDAFRAGEIKQQTDLLNMLDKMKTRIKHELTVNLIDHNVTMRDEFVSAIEALRCCCDNYFAITTNWDDVAASLFNNSVIHLHGSARSGDDLYLPSEVSNESYRTPESNERFEHRHFESQATLAEADGLLIYGLSFSPLDAELSRVFWNCFNSHKLKRILVVDPDFRSVLSRIQFNFITRDQELEVFGVDPRTTKSINNDILECFAK